MTISVVIDWKLIMALGTVAAGIVLVTRMDDEAVERVSTHAIDAIKDCVVAYSDNDQAD